VSQSRRPFEVAPLTASHIDVVVQHHRRQFPTGFYSRLGHRFMSTYFREYLGAPGSVGLVARLPGADDVVGYLIGTIDRSSLSRGMFLRSAPVLVVAGGAALSRRPAELAAFTRERLLRYVKRYAVGVAQGLRGLRTAELEGEVLYIYTHPEHRRHGCGDAMMRTYLEYAARIGLDCITLITEDENVSARTFYAHRGWMEVGATRAADGRDLVRLRLELARERE